MDLQCDTALNKLLSIYEGYSKEHRATIQPFHLLKVQSCVKEYKYRFDDILIREPLIEHSGSLPIVATFLYPYINNSNVDLGRALIMLAIHDIGELVTGDQNVFTNNNNESKGAIKLLDSYYHSIYYEMENRTSDTARFAKAIDKITPDLVDLMTPVEITINRYKMCTGKNPGEIVPLIKEFKHKYMTWNEFMTEFHLLILNRLESNIDGFIKNKGSNLVH
ncbi:MAG: HD domain-containing protein [bacterium]